MPLTKTNKKRGNMQGFQIQAFFIYSLDCLIVTFLKLHIRYFMSLGNKIFRTQTQRII